MVFFVKYSTIIIVNISKILTKVIVDGCYHGIDVVIKIVRCYWVVLIEKVSLKKSLAIDHCNDDLGSFIPLFKSGKFAWMFKVDMSGLTGSMLSS